MMGWLLVTIALLMLALVLIPGARNAINPIYIGGWIALVVMLLLLAAVMLVQE